MLRKFYVFAVSLIFTAVCGNGQALEEHGILQGTASTSSSISPNEEIALKKEFLFRDFIPSSPETVSDYDALVFSVDGSEIYGQILKPDRSFGKGRPCVLFFHGFAGFGRFDDIAQALCRAGCVVLIPHHRGAWGSEGKYSIPNCVQDAESLARFVRTPEFSQKYHTDPDLIFLAGHSMGGNTALNAAARLPWVRGIVLLAPCDIGFLSQTMGKAEMKDFLIDNGLEVLKTDGFEPFYQELKTHEAEYLFTAAGEKLGETGILLIIGTWDRCVPREPLDIFWKSVSSDENSVSRRRKEYPASHGLMGVREKITRDIADFILETHKDRSVK